MEKEKILLVDDEPTIVELCNRFLSQEGYQIKTASNGTAALRLMDKETFDLIVTDIRMRGMSGLELINEAKKKDPGIAIVVVTGHGTVNMAIESLKLGTLGFVIKPFTRDELLAAVRHANEQNYLIKENFRFRSLMPLFEINRKLVSPNDKELFGKITETARAETRANRASLMLLEKNSQTLRVEAYSGFPKIIPSKLSRKVGQGVSGTVAQTLKPLVIQGNENQNPALAEILDDDVIFSSISVPIIGKGLLQLTSLSGLPERKEHLIGVLNVSKDDQSAEPFNDVDLEFVNLLAGQAAMAIENTLLYKELHTSFVKMIRAMVATIELKDPYTAGHSENVSRYAVALAEEMDCSPRELEEIAIAGVLHDIGKIGSSEDILMKETQLSKDEFRVIKKHPENAARIMDHVGIPEGILKIILHHHERCDGKGYPHGLKGDEIPLGARIIMVADTIDAITSKRPYRKALPVSKLRGELQANKGPQFDPDVVNAFERLLDKKGADFFQHRVEEF